MVITKKIIVPSGQKEEELELTVEAEANQYIPFALDEVNLDFQVLGPAPNNPEEVEVLIAASRKEKVEDRVAIAESAGLKPRVMDVESYATQEAFRLITPTLPANGRDQNIALVDIGAHVTHFYVLRNNQFLFSRDQALRRQPAHAGHPARLQPVARGSRVRQEEPGPAGELRQRRAAAVHGDAGPRDHPRAAVLLHVDVVQPGRPDRAGRRLRALPGLDELVAKRAGVATVVANPFAAMQTSDRIRPRQLAQDAPLLTIATGLALRSFE